MDTTCHDGLCAKCHGAKWIVFGIVLFVATWYAKDRANVYLIWYALAVLAVIKGLMKLAKPMCPHCTPMSTKKEKK